MIEGRSPTDLVFALVRVINGDLPRLAAQEILDPMVQIHLDSAECCGIDIWYKWVHLIHNYGRVADLRITDCEMRCNAGEPYLVHLSARWMGTTRSRRLRIVSARNAQASYLVLNGRILEIWTHRSNYEFIFGRWIKYSIFYWIFLGFIFCYFRFYHPSEEYFTGKAPRSVRREKDRG